jgi:hypothetical protein
MTRDELVAACEDRLSRGITYVCLVVPGPPPTGLRVFIDRENRRGPKGEVANWLDNPPRTVAYFDCRKVLAYIEKLDAEVEP